MNIDACLLGLMLIAVISDLRTRRIPNVLIVAGLGMAFLYHGYTGGWQGLFFSLKGFGLGMALLILPFIAGGMGAGDVKLLGMIGAVKGSLFVFNTFIWMALWGGLIVIILLIQKRKIKETWSKIKTSLLLLVGRVGLTTAGRHFERTELSVYYPYGLAIGLGVVSCFLKGWC